MSVWYNVFGEWKEGVVQQCHEHGQVTVCPVGAWVSGCPVGRMNERDLLLEEPHDCGAMQPPQGDKGIAFWLEHDATVFCNAAGTQVYRPRILWERE